MYVWARGLFGTLWKAIYVESSDPTVSAAYCICCIAIHAVHLLTDQSFANKSTIYFN